MELAVGDFADRGSLDRALRGVDRLFLACGNVPAQVEHECAVIDAAQAAGVGRVVKLSGPRPSLDSPVPFERWHAEIERHLVRSAVPYVLLRPSTYMTNLVMLHADAVRATGRLLAPLGAAEIAFVDPRDVAAAAAATLAGDGHEGAAFALTGPEALTYRRIAQALSAATGRPIEYVDVPEDAARQGMAQAGLPAPMVDGDPRRVRGAAGGRAGAHDPRDRGAHRPRAPHVRALRARARRGLRRRRAGQLSSSRSTSSTSSRWSSRSRRRKRLTMSRFSLRCGSSRAAFSLSSSRCRRSAMSSRRVRMLGARDVLADEVGHQQPQRAART